MKYPGLTKILSLVLALLSLSLLVSGIYGLYTAARDRNRGTEELEKIRDTTDEYRSVLAAKMEPEEYEKLSRELETRQKSYDTDAAKHRKELAAFTASRGAMEKAEELLSKSETALRTARTQYESGKKALELQEKTIKKFADQVSEWEPMLEAGENLLDVIERLRDSLSALDDLTTPTEPTAEEEELSEELLSELEQDAANARKEAVLAAYDAAISAYENTASLIELIQDREIPVSQIKQLLGLQDNDGAEELKKALKNLGIELSEEQLQTLEGDSIVLLSSQQVADFKQAVENAAGMSMDEMLSGLRGEREAIANDEDGLSVEEFETIRQSFQDIIATSQLVSGVLRDAVDNLGDTLENAREKLSQLKDMIQQMKDAQAKIDKAKTALKEAGEQLAQGELALEEGKKQLAEQQEKLDEQEKELEKEKIRLDEEEQALKKMDETVNDQKELEDRERSLRMSLLTDREIKAKTESGTDILVAAEERTDAFGQAIRREYGSRFGGCLLMLAGTVLAFLSVAAVFRGDGNRKLFLSAVLLCVFCCTAVIRAFLISGRGLSYSALVTGAMAAAALGAALPTGTACPGKVYK